MSQTERVHQIVHLLETSRHPVPITRFLDELEVSRATFKRDIEYLRDRLGAPIVWHRGSADTPGGYRLDHASDDGAADFRLPGLWFNQSEIYALLTMHQLLGSMQPGLLAGQSQSLLARITHMLGTADDDPQAVLSYLQILQSATRRRPSQFFELVARATVRRKRLAISYYTRSRDDTTERSVSPQRLLHYRENWYLLAWCHRADGLRLFAVDAIQAAELQQQQARTVTQQDLDGVIGKGFGIFGGTAAGRAVLRFSPEAARWIADEVWHPDQQMRRDGEHLVLEVPYAQPRELLMEILKHGRDVEIIEPPALRRELTDMLQDMLARYQD